MKLNKEDLIYIVVIVIMFWSFVTNAIQAVKCPEMTNTELFFNIPHSFILNYVSC